MRVVSAIALAFCSLWLCCEPAFAERRIALVIGNSAYERVPQLSNPVNDAGAMAQMFRGAGFDIVELKLDLKAIEMRRALRDFADDARGADVAIIYFAGHGLEIQGTNYLVPVDAVLERDVDAYDEAVSLERFLNVIEPARQLRVVILDACRDNPFAKSMKHAIVSRAIDRGLAKIDVVSPNTLVAFAAKAGSTAADGNTKNSPFTAALVKYLPTPGLDLRKAFGFVRDDVLKVTRNKQEPFLYSSLGGDDVALVPGPPPQAPIVDPGTAARDDYELAAQINVVSAWDSFLKKYPSGFYSDLARAAREKLVAARAAAIEQARIAAERKAADDASAAEAERARLAAEAKAAEDARIAAEKARAEEEARAAQAREAEKQKALAAAKAREDKAARDKAAEDARLAAEKKVADEARAAEAERARIAAERAKAAEEARIAAEKVRLAEEQAKAAQAAREAAAREKAQAEAQAAEAARQAAEAARKAKQSNPQVAALLPGDSRLGQAASGSSCAGMPPLAVSLDAARALSLVEECGLKPKAAFRECQNCPEMVVMPAGEFLMGSSKSDIDGGLAVANEAPQHKVMVKQTVAIARFEVTRDQFAAFVNATGYRGSGHCFTFEQNVPKDRENRSFLVPGYAQEGNHPAVCVSWDDAQAYADWLSKTTGKTYRLPSEAEYEYAARAGGTARFAFTDDPAELCRFANGADESAKTAGLPEDAPYMTCSDGYPFTAPVGSFAANAFGLHDLIGNVWEWTADCFADNYTGAGSDSAVRTEADCKAHAVRGGDWFSTPMSLRPAVRAKASPDARHDDIGFRVVRVLVH